MYVTLTLFQPHRGQSQDQDGQAATAWNSWPEAQIFFANLKNNLLCFLETNTYKKTRIKLLSVFIPNSTKLSSRQKKLISKKDEYMYL